MHCFSVDNLFLYNIINYLYFQKPVGNYPDPVQKNTFLKK